MGILRWWVMRNMCLTDGGQPVLGGGDKQDKLEKHNWLQNIPHETFNSHSCCMHQICHSTEEFCSGTRCKPATIFKFYPRNNQKFINKYLQKGSGQVSILSIASYFLFIYLILQKKKKKKTSENEIFPYLIKFMVDGSKSCHVKKTLCQQ